jgi:hypothetical protein
MVNKPQPSKRLIVTIATLIALAMFPVAYLLNKKKNEVITEHKKFKETIEGMETLEDEEYDDNSTKLSLTERFVIKESAIVLPATKDTAIIKVVWQSENIYLLIKSLSKLPVGEKYEVWSIAGGKRTSLGLFDAPAGNQLIIKAEKANMTDDYDIKVVKENPASQ